MTKTKRLHQLADETLLAAYWGDSYFEMDLTPDCVEFVRRTSHKYGDRTFPELSLGEVAALGYSMGDPALAAKLRSQLIAASAQRREALADNELGWTPEAMTAGAAMPWTHFDIAIDPGHAELPQRLHDDCRRLRGGAPSLMGVTQRSSVKAVALAWLASEASHVQKREALRVLDGVGRSLVTIAAWQDPQAKSRAIAPLVGDGVGSDPGDFRAKKWATVPAFTMPSGRPVSGKQRKNAKPSIPQRLGD